MSEKELSILKKMPIGSQERVDAIFYLYDKEKQGSEAIGLIDIFNYGYMMGKRDERAKRKALR